MIKIAIAKKFIAFIANLSLLFNSFVPFLLVAQPAYAQSSETLASTISYNQSANKLNISLDTSDKIAYQLFYKTNEKIDAIAGTDLNQSNNGSSFYFGTCSAGDCLPQNVTRGILKIELDTNQFSSKLFTLENNVLTVVKEIESFQSDLTDEENNFLENIEIAPQMGRRMSTSFVEPTPTSIPTATCNNSSFDTLNLGNVDGQGGWGSFGSYDQEVVPNTYGFSSLGCKTLRLSNAVASGSFGDQTFSFSATNEAGETSATNGGKPVGTRQNHFEAQFDFASTQSSQQAGLAISVSPDRGDGSRMSYLSFVDNTDGVDVFFYDVSGVTSPVSFDKTQVASNLSRTTTHTAKFVIDFVDGPSNDVVKIYIDGSLVKTGTTWENYFRYDAEASAEQGPRTTNDLIFRAGGSSVPANNGKGFLFDNVNISSSTIIPDTTPPTIDDFSITNPTNWGDTYNIYNIPNHKSIVSGLPTVGGSIKIGANFTDNEILTNIMAYLPGRGFFADSEFSPAPINNTTWLPVAQGKYQVSWNTRNGSDWRSVADGDYNFTFGAKDKGTGQNSVQNSTSKTISLTVDNTPPALEFASTAPSDNTLIKGTINLTANFNDVNGLMNTMIGVHAIQWFCTTNWPDNGSNTCAIDTTKLPDGPQKLTIAAKDKADNVSQIFRDVIIDNSIPTATIDNTTPKAFYNGSTNINVHATDQNYLKTDLYRVGEGTPFKTYNAPGEWFGLSWLSEGNYRMVVIDKAGNSSEYIFTIDKTAPNTPEHSSPSDNAFINFNDFWFDWKDINDAVSYEMQNSTDPTINSNGSFSNVMWTGDYQKIQPTNSTSRSVGANGTWYWQVRSVDAADNKSAWSAPWKITIDKVAPTATVSYSPTGPTNQSVVATLIPSENVAVTNNFGLTTYSFDQNGIFIFQFKDAAGNTGYAQASVNYIDKITPATPELVSPADGIYRHTSDSNYSNWSDVFDSSGVIYRYQSASDTDFTNIYYDSKTNHISSLTDSMIMNPGEPEVSYFWHVQACDTLGNCSAWSSPRKINIDNTAPVITIGNYITTPTNQNITVTATVNEDSLNTSSYTFTQNGSFDFIATDAAGNVTTKTVTISNIDKAAPDVFITSPSISITNKNVEIKGTVTDVNPHHYYLVIQDSKGKTVAGPGIVNNATSFTEKSLFNWNISSVTDGVYTIRLEARDAADNKDSGSTATKTITIDKTLPLSVITVPSNATSGSTQYMNDWNGSVKGTATDVLSQVKSVKLSIKNSLGQYFDGSNFVTSDTELLLDTIFTDGSWEYNKLTSPSADSYIIKSHAIDNADNMENTYTLTIVLDKTIPQSGLSLDPTAGDAQNGWYKTQPGIVLTGTDTNFEKIEYQWDSQTGLWNTYSVPLKLENEGSHILYYRVIDKAKNISEVGIKNIKWDQTDLNLAPQNVSANPNPTSGSTSKIKWDKANDNTGIDKYEIQWKLNDKYYSKTVGSEVTEVEIDQLTEGRWSVNVVAFDQSGRSKSTSIDLNVDRTGPVSPNLTLVSTGTGTATLSWNAVGDAKDYIVWYGSVAGTHEFGARVGNVNTYTVRGLGTGNYYFVVKAVDEAQNQSGNSNEVSTGTITGAAGTVPGQPADGFAPQVLGANTQITPTQAPAQEDGSVLGNSVEKGFNWYWLLILLTFPLYFGGRKILRKS